MTLRAIHREGYRIPDLAYLCWRDLQHLWGDDETPAMAPAAGANETAFTI